MGKKAKRKRCEAFGEYARYLTTHLDLSLWEFRFRIEPLENPGAYAETNTTEGRRLAIIRFAEDLHKEDPDTIHHVLIHELLHCVTHEQCETIRTPAHKAIRRQRTYEVIWENFRLNTEYTVDHLAYCFARLIPINNDLMRRIRGDD